jgi:hypothetical protein
VSHLPTSLRYWKTTSSTAVMTLTFSNAGASADPRPRSG